MYPLEFEKFGTPYRMGFLRVPMLFGFGTKKLNTKKLLSQCEIGIEEESRACPGYEIVSLRSVELHLFVLFGRKKVKRKFFGGISTLLQITSSNPLGDRQRFKKKYLQEEKKFVQNDVFYNRHFNLSMKKKFLIFLNIGNFFQESE